MTLYLNLQNDKTLGEIDILHEFNFLEFNGLSKLFVNVKQLISKHYDKAECGDVVYSAHMLNPEKKSDDLIDQLEDQYTTVLKALKIEIIDFHEDYITEIMNHDYNIIIDRINESLKDHNNNPKRVFQTRNFSNLFSDINTSFKFKCPPSIIGQMLFEIKTQSATLLLPVETYSHPVLESARLSQTLSPLTQEELQKLETLLGVSFVNRIKLNRFKATSKNLRVLNSLGIDPNRLNISIETSSAESINQNKHRLDDMDNVRLLSTAQMKNFLMNIKSIRDKFIDNGLIREFEAYLDPNNVDELSPLDHNQLDSHSTRLLKFWKKEGCEKYPRLALFARMIYSAPADSTSAERSFSVGRALIGLRRHKLTKKGMLSVLMMLKLNYHIMKYLDYSSEVEAEFARMKSLFDGLKEDGGNISYLSSKAVSPFRANSEI